MKDFSGKAAFITGGAGGIGFAMARAFGQRGMKVAIADVEAGPVRKRSRRCAARGLWRSGMLATSPTP
jgi:NAD(P)-dependent dehydrogenase (short-subunit alcohol dehydrogenase family)